MRIKKLWSVAYCFAGIYLNPAYVPELGLYVQPDANYVHQFSRENSLVS